ncbi:MAG: polyprenyl synthetase [Flavobacteriales bacterium]|nr:polyprenyl synthetase [Flavobacteriales bacterium]|tara:strand:+ start:1652 stop:2617 length:966 start_codon:yes stop_codon:yes gene_type:complete
MDPKLIEIIEKELNSKSYPSNPKELYEPIRYILSLGGKRIRPLVCMMAAEMFGLPADSKSVLHLAKGLEIFHNFSLVHDDIMDEAPLRRGKATVHEKWNRDIAILSGDVMLVQAYQELIQSESEDLKSLIDQFNRSAILVCEGQQFDMNFETIEDVSLEEYLNMIQLKTAELLACSLKMGAMLANASETDAEALYRFGINLGLSFQIQDDYLDSFADASKFGKQVGGDILANKKTYLLLKAKENASSEQSERLQAAMKLNGEDKVSAVLDLYRELGVDQDCEKAIDKHYQKALEELEAISVDAQLKAPLKNLAAKVMKRDH